MMVEISILLISSWENWVRARFFNATLVNFYLTQTGNNLLPLYIIDIKQMIEKQAPPQIEMQEVSSKQEHFQLKKVVPGLKNAPKKVTCVHLSGDTIYLGTRQSKLFIYKIEGHQFVDEKVLIPHCQIVSSIASNEKYFVTVAESDDEMPVSVWDVHTRMFITALKSHQSQVSQAIFLTEPGWMATSCWDCTVKIWDLRNILEWEDNIKTIESQYPVLAVVQVSADVIAFGGDDCYLNFWNWKSMECLGKYFAHAGSVTLIYSNGSFVLTAGGDHRIKQWQVNLLGSTAIKIGELDHSKENIENDESKGIARVSREVKMSYDSSIFLVKISSKDIFLLDRHGNRFLHRFGNEFLSCANNFKYNQNIIGMVNHNGRIYVATTKGEFLAFDLEVKKNPYDTL